MVKGIPPLLMLLLFIVIRRSWKVVGPKVLVLLAVGMTPVMAAERGRLEAALRSVSADQLHAHAAVLADDTFEGRAAGSRGGRAAAGYLLKRLRSSGLEPGAGDRFTQSFHGWELKANSDHWPFLEHDIPAVCLHTGLHDDYHRPSDDIEKINARGMQQVARYPLDRLVNMADTARLPSFRRRGWSDSPFRQQRLQQPLSPPAPRLGISWRYVEEERLPHCLVTKIIPSSPAAKAGLKVGDRILSVDGLPITGKEWLPAVILQAPSTVQMGLQRSPPSDESPESVQPAAKGLAAESSPTEDGPVALTPETITVVLAGQPTRLGLSWREDESESQSVYVTRVVPYSPAARAGIHLLDRIMALDSVPVTGKDDLLARLRDRLENRPEALLLTLETRGRIHDVVVPLDLPSGQAGDRSL